MTEQERKLAEESSLIYKIRPKILPEIVTYYDGDHSYHPEQIRVSFDDGSTVVYDIKPEMPHPVIMRNIKIIHKWKQGYVNKPMRRRKP